MLIKYRIVLSFYLYNLVQDEIGVAEFNISTGMMENKNNHLIIP